MSRFSKVFRLSQSQAELDFVDIDLAQDNRLYLDPYAIQIRDDEWSSQCGDAIRSFFHEVLDALRTDNQTRAQHLLSHLHEPNETFLGQSRGRPSGRGVGHDKAADLLNALRRSRAFKTGLISDISEAELFIENIGPDTISDLTTNILRGLLAGYTLAQCELHGLATQQTTLLGPAWSSILLDWESKPLHLPLHNNRPVLLIPKYSVRRVLSLNSQEFWNHHMISYLQREYLDSRSALVRTFKNGTQYVTKKSVKERHPFIKDELATFAQKHPEVLAAYKSLKGAKGPLEGTDFDEEFDESLFAQTLVDRLKAIKPGNAAAGEYHSISMGILTFLFYPELICPVKEKELHEGRKRVDIKFTNAASSGFFQRMLQSPQARAISILVECKNYSDDPRNPEYDQLTSRYGHQRGFFGFLLCRSLVDRRRSIAACRDAASDGRGYMLVFEDADIVLMLNMVINRNRSQIDRFLQERFDEITH